MSGIKDEKVSGAEGREPAGDFYLVPREVMDQFPEININNYDHDDACALNAWGCEIVTGAVPAGQMVAPSEPVGCREALEECVSALEMVERPALIDPDHGDEVAALGDRIGYGALMTSASASWRARLEEDACPTGGEFVAGPCHSTVVNVLKRARAVLAAPPAPAVGREEYRWPGDNMTPSQRAQRQSAAALSAQSAQPADKPASCPQVAQGEYWCVWPKCSCQKSAQPADASSQLRDAMKEACDLLAERKYGSPARSPGHNARLVLERALSTTADASSQSEGD